MKIIRKPVDVIAVFKCGQLPMPLKVNMDIKGITSAVTISRVSKAEKIKAVGNIEIVYVCQGDIAGHEKVFELKYLASSLQWILYKI